MANTIKVIDLLNKIANGEELPHEIYADGDKYTWDMELYYKREKDNKDLFEMGSFYNTPDFLEKEIEIEEQQDIDIQEIEMFEQEYFNEHEGNMSLVDVDLAVKINEILKWAKQIDKNIKDKE